MTLRRARCPDDEAYDAQDWHDAVSWTDPETMRAFLSSWRSLDEVMSYSTVRGRRVTVESHPQVITLGGPLCGL